MKATILDKHGRIERKNKYFFALKREFVSFVALLVSMSSKLYVHVFCTNVVFSSYM